MADWRVIRQFALSGTKNYRFIDITTDLLMGLTYFSTYFKLMTRTIIILLITASFVRCAYDVEEELFVQDDCIQGKISYAQQVVPILQTSCYGCHAIGVNSGGVTVEGYDNLIKYIDNGRLLGSIKHQSGFAMMPQNAPMLPSCQIRQIEVWIEDGAMNN